MNAKKWEVELSTLKSNNARLTAALQESTANVEEWKKQLQAYKEENQRLKQRTLEAEAARGNADAAAELRKEISLMREKVDLSQQQLKAKDEEIRQLKEKGSSGDGTKVGYLLPFFRTTLVATLLYILMPFSSHIKHTKFPIDKLRLDFHYRRASCE